jgi:hypothetical protein
MVSYVICKRDSRWYGIGKPGRSIPTFHQVYLQILPEGVQPIRTRCLETADRYGIKFVWVGEVENYLPGEFELFGLGFKALAYCKFYGAKESQIFVEDTPEFDDKFHGGKTLSEREALLN